MSGRWGLVGLLGVALVTSGPSAAVGQSVNASPKRTFEYQVLAATRTSTMERELNEAAAQGYRFQAVMGGDTFFGGSAVVALVMRGGDVRSGRYVYRLLATGQTSTMQEELQEAGGDGFKYRGQTVFESFFGGKEVVVILERDDDAPDLQYDYLLLATTRTSTLEEELFEVGQRGYEFMGLSAGKTAFGGEEVVVITRRVRPPQ